MLLYPSNGMNSSGQTFTRYLPLSAPSAQWGWHLVDVGRQQIPADASYPGKGHPLAYLFDPSGRRILNEFQVVFITSGRGSFTSASMDETAISAGDAILLFPGEWHRYQPAPGIGWNEYWVGFGGSDATRVMETFFSPEKAIQQSTQTDELIRLFDQLLHWVAHPIPGNDQLTASFVPMILAFLRSSIRERSNPQSDEANIVLRAKMRLLENLSTRTDLEALADTLGTSYSRLRSVFKRHTGYAPREFENMVKLNRARDLLIAGHHNVSKTAESLGYSSVYYFSRAFRQAFGQSPHKWLKTHRSGKSITD